MNGAKETELVYRMFIQSANLGLETVNSVAKIIEDAVRINKSDPVNKALAKILKDNKGMLFTCENEENARNLSAVLKKNGIINKNCTLYDKVKNGENPHYYVVFSSEDKEKAEQIARRYYLSQEKGITSPANLNEYANGKTEKVEGLTEVQTILLISKCEEKGIPVTVNNPVADKYSVKYAEQDASKIERALLDTSIQSSGTTGKHLKKQINWINENKSNLSVKASSFAKEAKRGERLYIIDDGTDKTIEINRKTISINGRSYANNGEHNDEIKKNIAGMKNPCVMSKEEYEKNKTLTREEKHENILKIQRENGRPAPSAESLLVMKKEKEARNKVEEKLRMNHSEEVIEDFNPYNNEEAYMGLYEKEKKNRNYDHDQREVEFDDAALADEAQAAYTGLKSRDSSDERYEPFEEAVFNTGERERENEVEREYENMREKDDYEYIDEDPDKGLSKDELSIDE